MSGSGSGLSEGDRESDTSERPDGLAVVGTGTGVGKTVVTAGITRWLRESGADAVAVKPCQTGHPPDDDAGIVRDVCDAEAAAVCHRALEPPLAPTVAAERTGTDLSYDAILADCRETARRHETVVVEGIGGLRVPLAEDREVLDLVADLGFPALVVARATLGTLNHTALSVAALRDRDVPVRGVVLNRYEGASVAERTNPGVVRGQNDLAVATLPAADSGPAAARSVPEHVPAAWIGIGETEP